MSSEVSDFGYTEDRTLVKRITLKNAFIEVSVITYGATLQALRLHNGDGIVDVVLGYDTVWEYERNNGRLGATIGRIAGRTSGEPFEFDGRTCSLTKNRGDIHIHGGNRGFDKRVWYIESVRNDSVVLSNVALDGEEGYPGRVTTYATFRLEDTGLMIRYDYKATNPTVIAVTNH